MSAVVVIGIEADAMIGYWSSCPSMQCGTRSADSSFSQPGRILLAADLGQQDHDSSPPLAAYRVRGANALPDASPRLQQLVADQMPQESLMFLK